MSERPAARNGAAGAEPILSGIAQRIGLAAAARIRTGCLVVALPDGSRRVFGDAQSTHRGEIRIHDARALVRALLNGETGVGEAYVDGFWSSPDLVALIGLAALNRESLALSAGWWRAPTQLLRTLAHRARRNTRKQSRRNIAAHYDLGNDFYRLFLDETMTYSSAVFTSPDQSLADAQRNKYRLMAERAGLVRGQHVLEIGTGWGGFALYAAGVLGCRVTTITISRAQAELARERVREAGLDGLVDVQLRDYREIDGTFDAIVSIEMLEAVGAEYLATFFEACDRALAPGGRLSLQSITFPADGYEAQRRGANWIQLYIFPGGHCPSLTSIEQATRRTKLRIARVDDIGPHYASTLRAWRERFLERVGAVRALGFDDRFVRMWEYYLALSEAAFATGTTQDLQVVLEKGRGAGQGLSRPAVRAGTSTVAAPAWDVKRGAPVAGFFGYAPRPQDRSCPLSPEPFPRDALDANRSGRLTPGQAILYRGEAASDRRTMLIAGLAIAALGAAVVFGSLSGRVPGSRLESLLVGVALLAVGVVVAYLVGIRGSQAKAAAAVAGRVASLEGLIRRERRDRRDGLFGDDSSHISPGNEYAYSLLVGDRSFSVSQDQWDAAPQDGVVRVYLLGDSDRIVNLERIADAPPPQVPGLVRAALELASSSPDPARAADARAMLRQADAMSAVVGGLSGEHAAGLSGAPVGAANGAPAVAAMAGDPQALPTVPLEQAILGTWQSDLAGMTYTFRADGSAAASSARHGAREQRWSVAGPGTITVDDSTVQVTVDGDILSLGEPPRSLTFHRVG